MKEPDLGAGSSGANVLNVNIKYTEESAKSQVDWSGIRSKLKPVLWGLLALSDRELKQHFIELQKQGYSRLNVEWKLIPMHVNGWDDAAESMFPHVADFFVRADALLTEVFGPTEAPADVYARRKYWTSKGHPHPELAADGEQSGSALVGDLHKQAAQARGDLPDAPDSRLVVQRCLQIARQYATRGKKADEPTWFATLKILAACTPDLTRECSDGHAKFNEPEFQAKLERIRDEKLRPATCNHMNQINPGGCVGCSFTFIRSPMALAYQNLPKMKNSGVAS